MNFKNFKKLCSLKYSSYEEFRNWIVKDLEVIFDEYNDIDFMFYDDTTIFITDKKTTFIAKAVEVNKEFIIHVECLDRQKNKTI